MDKELDCQKPKKVHHGRNVRRLREIFNIKQKYLGDGIGKSQQTISRYEVKKILDDDILEIIASFFCVTVESIKTFDDESIIKLVKDKLNGADNSVMNETKHNYTLNPFVNEKKVFEEKENLNERQSISAHERIGELEMLLKIIQDRIVALEK